MPCFMIFTNILLNVPFNFSLAWLGECATKNWKVVRMIVSCYFQANCIVKFVKCLPFMIHKFYYFLLLYNEAVC